ncbi:MAG TPA: hypothetical protein VIS72_10990 [Anaerolineales bacterium]
MAYTKLIPHFTPSARVDEISSESSHYLLTIPPGKADKYRVAQLDDYPQLSRGQFPHRFREGPSLPLRTSLSLSARTSSDSIPGTWGFGLWNDPFGFSLGYGGKPFCLPALPNAVWFFGASEENYLSFKEPFRPLRSEAQSKGASTTDGASTAPSFAQRGNVANGFLAQSFRSPKFHPMLILAGLALPFSRKLTRRLMSKVIAEEGVALSVDVTQWHRYRLKWSLKRVSLEVDEAQVFEADVSPNPPLGLVIWIDNQYAAFTPEGKIGFGVLENPEPAWLEVKDIEMSL